MNSDVPAFVAPTLGLLRSTAIAKSGNNTLVTIAKLACTQEYRALSAFDPVNDTLYDKYNRREVDGVIRIDLPSDSAKYRRIELSFGGLGKI